MLVRQRRRAVGMEAFDRLQAPSLALLALLLRPRDRLPVRRQHQTRAGVRHLNAVASGLVDVQEEGLLDRVLMRPGLDEDAVLQEDIRGAQDVLAAVERIGDVVEAALYTMRFARVGEVVALVRAGQPHAGLRAVFEHDALSVAEAEIALEELP